MSCVVNTLRDFCTKCLHRCANKHVKSEILRAVTIKIEIFWNVTP